MNHINTVRVALLGVFGIFAVFAFATLLANFNMQALEFLRMEWELSKTDFAEFHPGYFWTKLLLMLAGVISVLTLLVKLLIGKLKHESSFWILGFAGLVMLGAIVLSFYEYDRRNRGFRPGVLGVGFTYKDTLIEQQFHKADERGMTHLARPWPWQEKRGLNAQGFVSSFDYDSVTIARLRSEGKKIIFIIGDSFVEGITEDLAVAGQYDSTFVEMLRAAHPEYAICAFGAGGTDPVNFKLIAEKFIPALKPDLVLLVVCWNDMMIYDVPAVPHVPVYWQTNCGWLKSVVPLELTQGELVILHSAQEAYDYYSSKFTLWTRSDITARMMRSSCLLTNFYMRLKNISLAPLSEDYAPTYKYLKGAYDAAQQAGSMFSIAFIPDFHKINRMDSLQQYHEAYGMAFGDLLPLVHFPVGVVGYRDYIGERNQHFNDAGNKKFRAIVDSLITAQFAVRDFSSLVNEEK